MCWLWPRRSHLYTDASTSTGFGGCFQKKWVYGGWSGKDILVLGAYVVVVAVVTWGQSLCNRSNLLHVDYQALVHIINLGIHLLRLWLPWSGFCISCVSGTISFSVNNDGGDYHLSIMPRFLCLVYGRVPMVLGNNYDVLLMHAVILTVFDGFFSARGAGG